MRDPYIYFNRLLGFAKRGVTPEAKQNTPQAKQNKLPRQKTKWSRNDLRTGLPGCFVVQNSVRIEPEPMAGVPRPQETN